MYLCLTEGSPEPLLISPQVSEADNWHPVGKKVPLSLVLELMDSLLLNDCLCLEMAKTIEFADQPEIKP